MGTNARPALPTLIALLGTTNSFAATDVAGTLGALKLEPQLVVPALVVCLQNTNEPRRLFAARSLGAFGKDARAAVPSLVQALADPSIAVQRSASNALLHIDPKALERVKARATEDGKNAE